ncbi:hypothetical protein Z043_123026 [Scleropages formosus]|nr:hypothetical protein Z043_123026 [Scleropages formosus]
MRAHAPAQVSWKRVGLEDAAAAAAAKAAAKAMQHSVGIQTVRLIKNIAVCLVLLPRFLVAALVLWLLDFLCIRRKVLLKMREQDGGPDDPPVCVSDSNRMFSWESLKAVWHGHKLDFFKSAHLGYAAPNTEVVRIADRARSCILDFARAKRPLILNFGSCT